MSAHTARITAIPAVARGPAWSLAPLDRELRAHVGAWVTGWNVHLVRAYWQDRYDHRPHAHHYGGCNRYSPSTDPSGIPDCIVMRESGGSWTAENPTSSASGRYQFLDGTFAGAGGYAHASDAPPEVQIARAIEVWDGGNGCAAWSAC